LFTKEQAKKIALYDELQLGDSLAEKFRIPTANNDERRKLLMVFPCCA